MPEPIKWHATEDGLCHIACEAWKENGKGCPWEICFGGGDHAVPGEPCGVHALLVMIGRSPGQSATAKPTCSTCPYYATGDSTCRAMPPRIAAGEDDVFAPVEATAWCAKHPKIEALRTRAAMQPAQAMIGQFAEVFKSLRGG